MSEINNLFELDWRGFIYSAFLIMASLIALHKVVTEFIALCKRGFKRVDKNNNQDIEIEALKTRFGSLEATIKILLEAYKVLNWDRIMHFGMNYIKQGYVLMADKDCLLQMVELYKLCGGNGHLKYYVPILEALPITEELTDDEIKAIDEDEKARELRVKKAQASLSAYYGK